MTFDNIKQDNLAESKPKAKSKPKPILKLVIDPGTSLSKILYIVNEGTVKWMTMGAEYLNLPPQSADELLSDNRIMGLPEDNSWIRFDQSGECHLVGYVAKDNRATTSIQKLKHESLIYKVLAAVGAIASREKLGSNFKLELAVLLPLSEYRLEVDWQSQLKKALSSFYFQNQRLKVNLSFFACKPEGYGITLYTHQQNDADYFRHGNTVILMMGYRNTSCLFFHRGTPSQEQSQTTDLGFYTLLDKVIRRVPGWSREDLIKAISTETDESWSKPQNNKTCLTYSEISTAIDFDRLTKSKDSDQAELEQQRIQQAYDTSLTEYWTLLSNWLDEILPRNKNVDAIIVAGGSSDLLKDKLEDYAENKNSALYFPEVTNQLKRYLLWRDAPEKKRFMEENLGLRFADAWGFFVCFADYDLSKILDRKSGEVIKDNGN